MDKETLINNYFEGSLNQEQLEEFDRFLANDSEFAADFKFQQELQLALKKEERSDIKKMLSTLKNNNKETKVIRMRPWLAAASIAFVLGLGAWMLYFNSPDISSEDLYAANFTPYDNLISPIERGDAIESLKARSFAAYENAEYKKALTLFNQLRIEHNDPYINFYEANVRMQLNQHDKAISLLNTYIENNGQWQDRATWYLALSHLKLGHIAQSKTQLNTLIQFDSFKTNAAKKLLDQLD